MSILQRIRQVLDARGLPAAGRDTHGYFIEEEANDTAIVRWGRGEPFRDVQRQELRACQAALRRAGYHIVLVRFAGPPGAYLRVADRP